MEGGGKAFDHDILCLFLESVFAWRVFQGLLLGSLRGAELFARLLAPVLDFLLLLLLLLMMVCLPVAGVGSF